ncbi:benzoate 4-monooxygenase cytochrome P450 [Blumeria hordei DH14]|uniref:Benzoate 4-monooxygenase cytochrome P450 n=1 Tax=Blumeria graminis f. sp. hordei (strain DH14) TaxID=546991 RepID=N1JL02_BLUG1|nr:benzoate 4-monooxygenase cytochrome P450 [Blumeria hordei DH14]
MLSFTTIAVLITSFGISYATFNAIYNFYFHPLRKYPGPVLNRLTYMKKGYHVLKGDYIFQLKALHRKYGHVVRVTPTELSYIDEQAWSDIYAHSNTLKSGNLPKNPNNFRPEENGATTLFTANDADHRRIRRIQAHIFSEKALTVHEPLLKSYIIELVSKLHEKASAPSTSIVDLVNWYNYTTFDILGDLAFGESFGCLRSDALHPWISNNFFLIKDLVCWIGCKNFPWPLEKLLYRLTPREAREARHQATDFASQKARDRMALEATDRVDLMTYILKHNDEKGMTIPEIEVNARTLILAGSETTATFLSGVTYHLLCYPQQLAKVTSLLRSTFESVDEITGAALTKLEFFNAVIEESFRLYPPATSIIPRLTNPGGSIICGELVPENTTVSIALIPASTSPDFWTDADEFVPERWCKEERCPEKYRNDNRKVMQPFSIGPRNCIGKNLAKLEIRLILAIMLWNFDFELQPDSINWKDQKVFGFWEKNPLHVKLISRKA